MPSNSEELTMDQAISLKLTAQLYPKCPQKGMAGSHAPAGSYLKFLYLQPAYAAACCCSDSHPLQARRTVRGTSCCPLA